MSFERLLKHTAVAASAAWFLTAAAFGQFPNSPDPNGGYPQQQYPQQQYPTQPPYPQQPSYSQQQPYPGNYPQQQGAPATGEPDVPGPNVARISLLNGDVSVKRGDSGEFVAAAINAPLMAQDYLSTGPSGRAEVQFDYGNMVRLGAQTEVRFVQMDAGHYQMQIARGTVTYRVRTDAPSQVELSTPSVSVRPARRGSYRIAVLDDGTTQITARSGDVEVYTPKGIERVSAGQTMMVRGTPDNPEFQIVAALGRDDWDMWNEQRDRQMDQSTSYQHMSRDIYGGEDLDSNGRWMNDPQYGDVWRPNVPADWAPYRVGRWAWEDYYGWTWVSGDPWGWAPYHYGSWYNGAAGWCWYPGPLYSHHFWRPALVAFFGFGGGFGHAGFGFGNIGWVPLAPFERFHPWYGRGNYGRGFGNNINIVHNTNITNVYRNARFGNGVTGVNAQDFSSGRFHNAGRVSPDQVRQAGLVRGAVPLSPGSGARRFSDRTTQAIPRSLGNQGRFYSSNQTMGRSAGFPSANRGWNQFGTPGAAINGSSAGRQFGQMSRGSATPQAPAMSSQGNSSWGRFGTPGATAATGPRMQQSAPAASPRYSQGSAQRTYSAPSSSFGNQGRYSQPYAQSSRSAPLQISPPIVREGAAQQQYSRPSYSGPPRQSYSAPSYSAPRSQSYSAPSQSRGGGGGYSAPRSYSAPSGGGGRSSGGGGGSSHSSGGGGSHGGGGGHRGR